MAVLAGSLAVSLSACGYSPSRNDPAANRESAQAVVDSFVSGYNEEGLTAAVDQNFCPDRKSAFQGRDSLDNAPYAAESMKATSPVSVNGKKGSAGVTVSPTGAQARNFSVKLTDTDGIGWCVSAVAPTTRGGNDDQNR
ncbi:MAG: hypothetical protein QM809_00005 [Gordonia sp. (in: high G+C Gram-positive bacteria)]|uniref:hypothetical protein n=1 Tax=Gordonia sp. (in: high G+C Gram-positive bacteria) TaxID=84139 RepID=UPI0039E40725